MARSTIDPPKAAELLRFAADTGFVSYVAGGVKHPHVIVLARPRGTYTDIAHIRGADRTEVARIPNSGNSEDIWRPEFVVWHYYGEAVTALTALLGLGHYAPRLAYEPPRDGDPVPLTVNADERLKVVERHPPRRTMLT